MLRLMGVSAPSLLVPRPHLPNDRKAYILARDDVKLRRHRRGFPLAKRCTNAQLRDRALVQRFANGKPRLCQRNLTSVTCQNVPGPPPAFPIVWEVGPGNEAT